MDQQTDHDTKNEVPSLTTNTGGNSGGSMKKRKLSTTTALGPGQAGGEARGVSELINTSNKKRSKQSTPKASTTASSDNGEIDVDDVDDDNTKNSEPTIAERLRLLQEALDAEDEEDIDDNDDKGEDVNNDTENGAVALASSIGQPNGDKSTTSTTAMSNKFVVKYATTESVTQLLVQGLQSSDGTMIEQAFQVRDKDILRKTCMSLSSDQCVALLNVLLQRLANKPNRAEQLVAWVSAILLSNQITDIEHLQPLQNLLQERLEVFPLLLQLEGRLENMIGMI